MTIKEVLTIYSNKLSGISPTPLLDVEILISHILGYTDKIQLMMNHHRILLDSEYDRFCEMFKLREAKMPIAYIINKKEFMELDFYVDENVLIPRPDTEIIVEETIDILNRMTEEKTYNKNKETEDKIDYINKINCTDKISEKKIKDADNIDSIEKINFIDMCTGSGAIVLSCQKLCKKPELTDFYGVDISKKALEVSKKNKINLGCEFVNFIESDLFSNDFFENMYKEVDIIVSNPPYIEEEVILTLEPDVKNYEPMIALSGGSDGMIFYNKIIEESTKYLKKDGYLIFESGHDQAEKIIDKMKQHGFDDIYTKKDIQGYHRAVIGRYNC